MSIEKELKGIISADQRYALSRMLETNLSFRERWEIAKAKAEAEGHARMVIADFLIEEGFMKRRFRKK